MNKYTCVVRLTGRRPKGWAGVVEAETPEQAASVARDREEHAPRHRVTRDQIEYVEVRALPTDRFLGEF